MLRSPLGRCLGIGVLLFGLVGLFVLGGAGWSLDTAVVGESRTVDEIGVFQDTNLDLGTEYRDSESPSVDASSASEPTMSAVTAGITADSVDIGVLFAPTDRSEAIHLGGLRFLYIVSLAGAAMVSLRAVVGWRFNGRELALEPRENVPYIGGDQVKRRPTPLQEQQSQSRE